MATVFRITLEPTGNSLGVTLPVHLVDDLKLEAGEEMLVMEADEGIYLSPAGSAFKQAYDDYQRLGRQYQTALEQLPPAGGDIPRNGNSARYGNGHGNNGNGTGRLRA